MGRLLAGFAIGGLFLFCGQISAGHIEIRYDDGTSEADYSAVSGGDGYAVKLRAPFYPCTLSAVKYFVTEHGDPTVPFKAVILDDGGPGGTPGCTLAAVDFASADTGNVWAEIDLPDTSSLVLIDSLCFYVAIYWYVPYNPSLGGDIQFAGGDTLSWRLYSGAWYNLGGLVDLMIRAMVSHPDSVPPSLSGTTLVGDTVSCGPFPISSIIVDDWVGVDPYSVHLFWCTNTLPWDSVNMLSIGGDTFSSAIPRLPEGDSVSYYVRASDLAGNTATDPWNAPDTSFSFLIVAEAPRFSSTTIWADTSFPGPYSIITKPWDAGSGLDTTSIGLSWRFDEGPWEDTSMTWYGTAQMAYGEIPQVPDPADTTAVRYYVEAFDLIGLRGTDPGGAPQDSTYHFVYTPPTGILETVDNDRLPIVHCQPLQTCPNPFASVTTITFHVSAEGPPRTADNLSTSQRINLSVYDLSGRLVKTLVDDSFPTCPVECRSYSAGTSRFLLPTSVVWDGKDSFGRNVSGGVYFCKLKMGESTWTKSMMLLK